MANLLVIVVDDVLQVDIQQVEKHYNLFVTELFV